MPNYEQCLNCLKTTVYPSLGKRKISITRYIKFHCRWVLFTNGQYDIYSMPVHRSSWFVVIVAMRCDPARRVPRFHLDTSLDSWYFISHQHLTRRPAFGYSLSRRSFWTNQLTGTIPSELARLTNLQIMCVKRRPMHEPPKRVIFCWFHPFSVTLRTSFSLASGSYSRVWMCAVSHDMSFHPILAFIPSQACFNSTNWPLISHQAVFGDCSLLIVGPFGATD